MRGDWHVRGEGRFWLRCDLACACADLGVPVTVLSCWRLWLPCGKVGCVDLG